MRNTKLEQARVNHGWTRAELARRSCMQPGVIGWIEEGRFIPYDSQINKLADALGIENPKTLLETSRLVPEEEFMDSAGHNTEMFAKYGDLLSVDDLHEITGLSKQIIRKQINSGELPGCHIGRRLFVPKKRLIEQVETSLNRD